MRHLTRSAATAAFASIFFGVSSVCASVPATNHPVAIIDLRKVAAESCAGKGIDAQVAEKNDQSKKELEELENKIKSMESDKLSSSDPRKVEELQLMLYDMVKERRFQISEAYRQAIETLETIIKEAVKEIANEKHIDAVLASDAVVFFSDYCADITDETIKRVNSKCSHIELVVKEVKNEANHD